MRILHPTDFSDASEKALSLARILAELLDGRLELLYASEPTLRTSFFGDYWDPSLGKVFEQAQSTWLEQDRQRLQNLDPGAVHHLEIGKPLRHILRHAKDVDLIVMGTHGEDTLLERLLGSTTERVIELTDKPVAVVRAEAEVRPFKRLLVSTGLASSSKRTLAFARRLADRSGADITLLHVIESVATPPVPIHALEPQSSEHEQTFLQRTTQNLHALAAEAGATPVLLRGQPTKVVFEQARVIGADAVFIGKSRRNRFMGSVAREVLERALVPVIVHP